MSDIREIERHHKKSDALAALVILTLFFTPPTLIFAVLWLCGIDAFGLMCLSGGFWGVVIIGAFVLEWPWRFLDED